jgi:hypothetical protein
MRIRIQRLRCCCGGSLVCIGEHQIEEIKQDEAGIGECFDDDPKACYGLQAKPVSVWAAIAAGLAAIFCCRGWIAARHLLKTLHSSNHFPSFEESEDTSS